MVLDKQKVKGTESLSSAENERLLYILALLSIPNLAASKSMQKLKELLVSQNFVNHDVLVKLILRHKILHCAKTNIDGLNIDEYTNTVKLLSKLKGVSAIRQTILYDQLSNVRSTFEKFNIPFREIKGFGLSEHLYPTKLSRDIKDIDIWTPRSMLPNAHTALLYIDAKLIKPTSIDHYGKIEVRYKDLYYTLGRGNLLELHMRLIPAKTKFSRYLDEVLAFRDLTPEEEFIYLCVHGVLSGYYRLRWLTDLHLFLLNRKVDVETVFTLANEQGVLKHLLASILLLERIFKLENVLDNPKKTGANLFSRISASIAMIICHRILANNRPRNLLRETLICNFLALICTATWADLLNFFRFFFGPSCTDVETGGKDTIKTRTKAFFARVVKLISNRY